MTRAQLRNLVVSAIGNRTDKDDLINTQLSLGLEEISKLYTFPQMLTTVTYTLETGSSSFTLSPTPWKVLDVVLVDGQFSRKIPIYPKRQVLTMYPYPSILNSGRPVICYEEASVIHFVPPTDSGYQVLVTQASLLSNQLASDTASPTIPGCDMALVHWTVAQVFLDLQMYADANVRMSQFQQQVALLIAQERGRVDRDFVARGDRAELMPSIVAPWLDPFAGQSENGR